MASFQKVKGHCLRNSGMTFSDGDNRLDIQFVQDDVVRVRATSDLDFTDEESYVVEQLSVGKLQIQVFETDNEIRMFSKKLSMVIRREPFSISVKDRSGRVVIDTPENCLEFIEERSIQRFTLAKSEGIYGLGQGTYPHLNLRDQERRMWHEWRGHTQNGPGGIPLMLSTRGYGFLLNSSWPSRFAIGKAKLAPPPDPERSGPMAPPPWPVDEHSGEDNPDQIAILLDNTQLDYFLIVRPTFPEILHAYVELTGAPPMPPQWALGYIQCKNRYRGPEELLEIARGYRKRGIPADVLVIDWLWFKTFGDLQWDKSTWPDLKAMAEELTSMGFKLMQAQHPFVDEGALNWAEFSEKGYLVKFRPEDEKLVGHQSIYDFTNPQARRDWWAKVRKLFEDGIRGYWIDMGEPQLHPVGVKHYLGSRERVHNIYSLLWAKALYEGQRSYTDQRVFSLGRTTYVGIQRYGAALWSGDIDCTWEVLRDQVIIGQEVCMSGQPYWTTDIGGFMLPAFYEPELYVRWLQWGMWCPIFRTHGTRAGNEPWSFGRDVEQIVTRFIKLRYELMPYIYTQARNTHETGVPMMQAMVMQYPDDEKAIQSELQFMFGPSFLVAPIVERGARQRQVYLPEGKWYDYWTDELISGPVEIEAFAPLERIPVYVKAGSIIPKAPEMLHTGEKVWDPLVIDVYPGSDAEFVLYEDDGSTYGYEKGNCAWTKISYSEAARSVVIDGAQGQYPGQPRVRAYQVVVHDQDRPEMVILDGKPVMAAADCCSAEGESSWSYCEKSRRFVVNVPHRPVEKATSLVIRAAAGSEIVAPVAEVDVVLPVLGVDVSRPDPRSAVVYAYIEKDSIDEQVQVSWQIDAPLGWRCVHSGRGTEKSPSGAAAFASWKLEVDGSEFTPGSEVTVTALLDDGEGSGCNKLRKSVQLTSEYQTHWHILASLPNDKGVGFDHPYDPETVTFPSLTVTYLAADGQPMSWQRYDAFDCFGYVNLKGFTHAGKQPFEAELKEAKYGLAYAVGKVWSPEKRSACVELLGEDRFKVWMNGKLVLLASDRLTFKPMRARVELKEGWNTMLIKSTQDATREWGGRSWGFYFRIVDEEGQVMKDLRYTAGQSK